MTVYAEITFFICKMEYNSTLTPVKFCSFKIKNSNQWFCAFTKDRPEK